MKSIGIFISLLTFSVLSLQTNALDLVNIKEFPDWFQEAMEREKKVKKKSKLKLKKFDINHKVKGKLKLVDEADGTWYYNIDIGTASPVECYVLSKYDGPANSLHAIIEMSLTGAQELNKKTLSGNYNYAIDTGIIKNTPYLLMDTLYALGEGNQKVLGLMKGLSAETDESLQICLHNEAGYRKTFMSVFESFLEAFIEKEKNTEFFESVIKMTINGLPVGYGHEKYILDEEGDVHIQSKSALIAPVDASSISRSDSVSMTWSEQDGSLINGIEYTVENNALTSRYSIQQKENKWQVEGEMQGKAISKELSHTGPLLTDFGTYLETKALSHSDKKTSEFDMWIAEADPTSTMKVKISKLSKNPKANFKIDMGPLVMDFKAKKNGVITQGTLSQGALQIHLETVFVKGEPNLP